MPIAQACYIAMKVCEGLDYAHNKRDSSGQELNLIHRDVSPQNVLVSFEGEVKIIDFGIAKAAGKGSKTQAGILKGKFGYMSPEQVRGLPIDRRSDVFSCGIVLYELLTGERLFVGESDFSTLEKVRNVEILPPSTYNRQIQPELERIVLKSLTRDVNDRYANAIDLHDELQAYVYTAGDFYSRKDLATWMKNIFSKEIKAEATKLEQFQRMKPLQELIAPNVQLQPDVSRRRPTTQPPPIPGRGQRSRPAGTIPPAEVSAASAAATALSWDDDELETSIYAEDKKKSAVTEQPNTPPPHTLQIDDDEHVDISTPDEDDPDLSSLLSQKAPWPKEPKDWAGAPSQFSGQPKVAHGSRNEILPSKENTPSAVMRLANMASSMPSGKDTARSQRHGTMPTMSVQDNDKRSSPWIWPLAAFLLLLLGAALVALLVIKPGQDSQALTPAEDVNDDNRERRTDDAENNAAITADGNSTGFDLIVTPPSVEVTLDNEVIGKAPLQIRNLSPGPHSISIEAPQGYFNKTETFYVEAGKAPEVRISLDAMEVMGKFESTPPGASVVLVTEGVRLALGTSPIQAKLDPSKRYEVMFEKKGFRTQTQPIVFVGGANVSVFVDMNNRPRTRASSRRSSVGPSSNDDDSATERLADKASQASDNERSPGTISIGSKPPCKIYVDGRDTGFTTPKRNLELSPGSHRITFLNLEHGIKETFPVRIKPGESMPLIKDFRGQISDE